MLSRLMICLNRHDSEINTKRGFLWSSLVAALLFIVIAVVARNESFETFEGTKSMIIAYASAAIWLGFSNTLPVYATEEKYIVHRIRTGLLSVSEYLSTVFVFQAVLAVVQALIATFIFSTFQYSEEGVVFSNVNVDLFITFLLTILGTAFLGVSVAMLCSSIKATVGVLPVVLICELLLSGSFFQLSGKFEVLSEFIHSKYTIACMGALLDLNAFPLRISLQYPVIEQIDNPLFRHSSDYVLESWGHLALLTLLAIGLSYIVLCLKLKVKK